MEKCWKIINISKSEIKISIKLNQTSAPGIILKPDEFCYAYPQMTTPLDAQVKRGFVKIEEVDNVNYTYGIGYFKTNSSDTFIIEEVKNSEVNYLNKKQYLEDLKDFDLTNVYFVRDPCFLYDLNKKQPLKEQFSENIKTAIVSTYQLNNEFTLEKFIEENKNNIICFFINEYNNDSVYFDLDINLKIKEKETGSKIEIKYIRAFVDKQ